MIALLVDSDLHLKLNLMPSMRKFVILKLLLNYYKIDDANVLIN